MSDSTGLESYGTREEKTARLELTRVLFRRESQPDPFDSDTSRPTGYIIRVFGGPAYVRAKQHVVTFQPDELEMRDGSGWAYHPGIDFSMFTSLPGLSGGGIRFGGTVRYTRGEVDLPGLLDRAPTGRPAGGWNFAGGVRFRL